MRNGVDAVAPTGFDISVLFIGKFFQSFHDDLNQIGIGDFFSLFPS